MKFGYCLNMVATRPDRTGAEHLETLKKLGFDYVELPCAEMAALDDEAFEAFKAHVKAVGVPCETSNNFFPPKMRLTGPDVDDAAIDAYVEKALSRLQALGVSRVVFGSGGAKNVPEGWPMEDGYRQVIALLKRIAPMAKAHGILIVIEPLRAVECNLINSFEDGVCLARDVDNENVRVLVDYYHLREMNEPEWHVAAWGEEFLRHVHFAQQEGRLTPSIEREDVHYRIFFDALKKANYDARVSCEAYVKGDFEESAARAIAFLRSMAG